MPMISVLLIDENAFLRACMRHVLEHEHDIEVVGEIGCNSDGFANAQSRIQPDVVIINSIAVGGYGLWSVRKLMQKNANTKIIFLIMHESIHLVERALKLGVKGVLCKTADPQMLLDCVRTIASGGFWLQGSLAQQLAVRKANCESGLDSLSPREFEVFCMLAKGLVSDDIAKQLHISARTVAVHRSNIMSKLGLKNIVGLFQMAMEYSLLPMSENVTISEYMDADYTGKELVDSLTESIL